MAPRKIVILGSTGSIGKSCLDVIRQHPEAFQIKGLAAYSNIPLLVEQYKEFHPEYICIVDRTKARELASIFSGEKIRVLTGEEDLVSLAGLQGVDVVVNAIVGSAGLKASLEAVNHDKILALANKESLVAGAPLFRPLIDQGKARILPIDSEHSAIWQSMLSGRRDEIRSIILTASGGPFRDFPRDQFDKITVEQALKHPTWSMGPKITIDSATLLNKGLEVIEAITLFGVPAEKIRVVVHPQSIIHSMVEFQDSSVIAQLSTPDMRLPITYALFWPNRVESSFGRIDWASLGPLTFQPPDFDTFPLLRLAFKVAKLGGVIPAVYNAANEVAVSEFLGGRIKFPEIAEIVYQTVEQTENNPSPTIEDIIAADIAAREMALKVKETIKC